MSAFICSDLHINTLASFAAQRRLKLVFNNALIDCEESPARVAGLLYTANVESVNQRYNEDEPSDTFAYREVDPLPSPVVIAKSCYCFNYQACEVDDYEKTVAYAITNLIAHEALSLTKYNSIEELKNSREYAAAPWGID